MGSRAAIAIFMACSFAGGCASLSSPPLAPGPATIARIESGLTLLDMIESVGVGDTDEMIRATRTRVRSVRCTATGPARAACTYEADRCLGMDTDGDGDGWCPRSTTFVYGRPQRSVTEARADGWTPEAPAD